MQRNLIDPLVAPDEVRAAVAGLIAIETVLVRQNGAIVIDGQLLGDAQTVYRPLRQRVEAAGFTPFLTATEDGVRMTAVPGVISRQQRRPWINLVLFLLTVGTVVWTGALNETSDYQLHSIGDLIKGLPFALTLLGILGTHEMGHFVVGRLRGAPVSWPFFIPMPPFGITGTLGAVIVQREPLEDRRTLLEVGIAGPLAGLAVAIPLLFFGLTNSPIGPPLHPSYLQEGNSLAYILAKWIVFGRFLPHGRLDVQLNNVAWGAWIGLLVTMLNLLPIGQLDGGHISYALFGRRSNYVAYAALALCLVLGVGLRSYAWLLWAALASLTGLRHPLPLNDVPRLKPAHMALAIVGLALFFLLLMPQPLTPVGG